MTPDQPETGGATEQGRFGDESWRPARETRAQRQWRPGTRRRRRSVRALVLLVVALQHGAGGREHLQVGDHVALALDAREDLADQVAGHPVRLDEDEGLFGVVRHGVCS